jgi:hypothetical protein
MFQHLSRLRNPRARVGAQEWHEAGRVQDEVTIAELNVGPTQRRKIAGAEKTYAAFTYRDEIRQRDLLGAVLKPFEFFVLKARALVHHKPGGKAAPILTLVEFENTSHERLRGCGIQMRRTSP